MPFREVSGIYQTSYLAKFSQKLHGNEDRERGDVSCVPHKSADGSTLAVNGLAVSTKEPSGTQSKTTE